jgi:ankyrin repeat protein
MKRFLSAAFLTLFDGPLWKAIAVAVASFAAFCILLLMFGHAIFGDEAEALPAVAVIVILLYFLIRTCRFLISVYRYGTATSQLRTILSALAVFHLLGFVVFFTIPFVFDGVWNLFSELFEVEFWVFPAIFVSLWGLVSLLIMLRYRNFHRPGEDWTLRFFSLGVCVLLLVIALGAMQLAPEAQSLFASFGADLPPSTLFFLQDNWVFLLLPALAAATAGVLLLSADTRGKTARFASGCLVALPLLANIALFGALGSLYLPLFKCGSFDDTGYTRLHAAVALGREASVLRQIAGGAPVDARDNSGSTALLLAVTLGHLTMANALLANGADATASAYGRTVMHAAAISGRIDIAELLLARGARVDVKDRHFRQPLHDAAYRGHLAMATLLLDRGADVNAETDSGRTPLDGVVANKEAQIAELLAGRGGVLSTKESRQRAVERTKTQLRAAATPENRFGSCGAV